MKRVFSLLVLALALSSCYKDELREVHEQVTEIRDIQIASLKSQAEEISGSIENLESLTADMKAYVQNLDDFGKDIQGKLDETTTNIALFKASADEDITSSQKELVDLMDKMNEALLAQTNEIKLVSDTLKAKDTSIEGKITSLKTYLEDLYARTDWAEATLATLEKQQEITADVTAVESQVETLEKSVKTLEKALKEQLSSSIDSLKKQFGGDLQTQVEAITDSYKQAIDGMSGAVSSEYTANIKAALQQCEAGLKTWVNEKLTEYYTVAAAEAQTDAFKLLIGNVPDGESLSGELSELRIELAEAKNSIRDAYKAAIKDAISQYEGRISDEMDKNIQEIDINVLQPLAERLTPIQDNIDKLWEESAKLSGRIKTVVEQSAKISTSIAVLKKMDKTLDEYVKEIQAKLEETDNNNRVGLKLQLIELNNVAGELQDMISDLESYVGTLPQDVDTDVNTWIKTTFSTLNSQFGAYATIVSVDEIVNGIDSRIAGHGTSIGTLKQELGSLIEDSKSTIEGWISEKLQAYTTAAEADGLLNSLETDIKTLFTDGDGQLQSRIDSLENALSEMVSRVETEYNNFITTSIETEQGELTSSIKSKADKISDEIAGHLKNAQAVEADIDSLIQKVSDLQAAIDDDEKELTELQAFLAANGYNSLKAVTDDLLAKISGLSSQYADKQQLDSVYNYINGEFKTESGRIAGLVSRMKDVTTDVSKLSSFLKGTDTSEGKLKTALDAIKAKIDTLENNVNGTGYVTRPAIEAQLSALEVGLYGAAKDAENPSEESICGMVNTLTNFLITSAFSTITYVPRYLDQTETLNYSGSNTATASFNFLVRPASIARFVSTTKYKSAFQMRFAKGGKLYDFDSQSISGSEDGIITIDVSDSRYELLKSGASAALYVTSPDDTLPSFTSKFIPISGTNGTDELYSNIGNLHYSPAGGTKSIYITSSNYFYLTSWPKEWISVTPEPNEYIPYDIRDYREFKITASDNNTFNSRRGDLVFRTISGKTLTIHVEQEGNLVLYSNIPASGGTFSDSQYTFTLHNNDENYPYIYLSEREGALIEEIFGYYISVKYKDGDEWKDFPTTKETAIKSKEITISLDASNFYLLLFAISDDTRLTFTTLSNNSEYAREGSSISFTVTRYHTLFVSNHNQTIK